jgi:hypothetical protein
MMPDEIPVLIQYNRMEFFLEKSIVQKNNYLRKGLT